MMVRMIVAGSVASVSMLVPLSASADRETGIETIEIIGSKDAVRDLAGSGALIDEKQFQVEMPTDINQLLKTVPGVYIREEEGLGLRPNIGIRGATAERSSKITLLEDGILIAPAPYAAPSAYYFPTLLRMSSVEVLKGAPLLRHGPYTTGGVVNLVSTPIPTNYNGRLTASIGEYNSRDLHAYYGGSRDGFSWLLETAQRDSEGFKDIDRSNRDSGYDIEDYVLKLGWEGDGHRLLFKAQYSEEVSDETYLGLTDADFDNDPLRRYGLSEIDEMDNAHKGYSLSYSADIADNITGTLTAYYNDFTRDWFKLSGGAAYIEAANAGDTVAQAILDGSVDVSGLNYKHNNRSYYAKGLDLSFDIDLGSHNVNVGVRTHEDEVDRYQPVEIYDQIDGQLQFREISQPGSSDNRVAQSEAISFWITDEWQPTEALVVNLALRLEDVDSEAVRFSDPGRTSTTRPTSNATREWLPGISLTYDLSDNWQVLAGVHKGFSPLGGEAAANEDPETSTNYEAGLRFQQDEFFGEIIAFYSDFENKAENCSLASPCSNGATSGTFVTGEAVIQGLEIQAGNTFTAGNLRMPLDVAYTYTRGEISADNPTTGFADGDDLADIPENLLSVRAGIESDIGWNNYLVAKYTDALCIEVGCNRGGTFNETEDYLVVDLISHYGLSEAATVFLKVENLFDEDAIVSRLPDGARPNKPRTATLGLEYTF